MGTLRLNKNLVIKQVLSILIPLTGVLFLKWDVMQMLVMFQLELLAIYLAFYISYYMLDKKSNFPFLPSLLMLLLSIPVILIILVVQYCVLYGVAELDHFTFKRAFRLGTDDFFDNGSWAALIYFTILELAYQQREKRKDPEHYYRITYYIFRRLLMSNIYLLVVCIPALFLEHSLFFVVPVLIGFKCVLELTGEELFLKTPKKQKV